MGVGGEGHALAASYPGHDTYRYRTGGLVYPRAHLDGYEKSCPYRVSRFGITWSV